MAKKKVTDDVNLIAMMNIDKNLMLNGLKIATSFSKDGVGSATMTLTKEGLTFNGVSPGMITLSMARISKESIPQYQVMRKTIIDLEQTHGLKEILDAASSEMIMISIYEHGEIIANAGKIKKSMRWAEETDDATAVKGETTIRNYYGHTALTIGALDIETIEKYMKGAANFSGEGGRPVKIERTADGKFLMTTEIATDDHLIIDATQDIKEKTNEKLKVLIVAEEMELGISRLKKWGQELWLYGATDSPLIMMSHKDMFEKDWSKPLEAMIAIAPRIETD